MSQPSSRTFNPNSVPIRPGKPTSAEVSVEYRHIEAFRQLYRENGQREPWIRSKTTRSSVGTALKRIESAFGSELFEERKDGEFAPSPFAQRLYNDTGVLENAMSRLMDSVSKIRERRLLKVGTSQAVFRTSIFRRIFRILGEMDDFRISYVAVSEEESGSALAQGRCDLYFGFGTDGGDRFISRQIAEVPLRTYVRSFSESSVNGQTHLRFPDAVPSASGKPANTDKRGARVSEHVWNRWLDHPAECAAGVVVEALEVAADPRFWSLLPLSEAGSEGLTLSAIHLRNHPYEFLMPLGGKLKNLMEKDGEA